MSTKNYYSIPFNGDLKLVETALKTGRVCEVYFATGPQDDLVNNYFGGCGNAKAFSPRKISRLLDLCRGRGVKTNLLCNAPSMFFSDRKKLFGHIRSLRGLSAITISDPIAIGVFKKEFPEKDLQASLIMNLDSYAKIRQALRLGIGTATLPGHFARNIAELDKVMGLKRDFPDFRVKLIANPSCFLDCLFLPSHYMAGLLFSLKKRLRPVKNSRTVYPKAICRPREPHEFISAPFIRPEDIGYYRKRAGVDAFKLVYRNQPTEVLKKIFAAYFREKFDGNLFELLQISTEPDHEKDAKRSSAVPYCDNKKFPEDFVKKVGFCDKSCEKCGYCDKTAEMTGFRL